MLCPRGHKEGSKVVDSRPIRSGRAVRRRRECLSCGARFTTIEEMAVPDIEVIKRDGASQKYDRGKILRGLAKALEKRPMEKQREELARRAEYLIAAKAKNGRITSKEIGKIILEILSEADEVAYLRFVSVYRGFGSAKTFCKEAGKLNKND